jgi:hypothetical protein
MSEQSSPPLLQEEDQTNTDELVSVPPLEYGPLRLLAETTAGLAGQQADLYFRGQALHRRGEERPEPADVLVFVSDRGRFPENIVTLGVFLDSPTHTVPVGVADAVFWSDSAVQKFLVPYLASVAGHGAADVLTSLRQVWNNYNDELVTVYALVHITAQKPGEVGLEHSIRVVYTTTGATELHVGSLAELKHDPRFRKDFIPIPTPRDVPYLQPLPGSPQRPGYRPLRAMAEWAASIRNTAQYFVFRAKETGFRLETEFPATLLEGDFMIPALTFAVPQNRPQLQVVTFQAEHSAEQHNLADTGDAVFWSTGALEQFLFPYYASKGGLQSLPDLLDMYMTWVDESAPAAYGIIHLPSSQWIEEDEAGPVVHDIDLVREMSAVARMDDNGPTRVVRLRRLI